MEEFSFSSSGNVKFPVHIRIGTLEGFQAAPARSTLIRPSERRLHVGVAGSNNSNNHDNNHDNNNQSGGGAGARAGAGAGAGAAGGGTRVLTSVAPSAVTASSLSSLISSSSSSLSDLYVTVQLWADSKPLTQAVQTAYKPFRGGVRTWNEWLELPFNIADLPLTAQLAITLWDLSPTVVIGNSKDDDDDEYQPETQGRHRGGVRAHHVPFGGTTIPLFDSDDTLHQGRHSCRLYRGCRADGYSSTKTPGFVPNVLSTKNDGSSTSSRILQREAELDRLEALVRKHHIEEMLRVDWLDALVFQDIAKKKKELESLQKVQRNRRASTTTQNGNRISGSAPSSDEDWRFSLVVDLPRFNLPVVYTDHEYRPTPISTIPTHAPPGGVDLKPPPEVQYGPGIQGPSDANGADDNAGPLIRVYDPEVGMKDNPAESKHRRLVRSHRTSLLDRDLKPNAKIRDELNTIMSYGPTQVLNGEETDLIWKFRHHLTREKRALTKFVKSVTWTDPNEARQAIQLLPKWTQIDVDDALELLGPTFENSAVRAYAVDRLRKADDEELLMYLLQLVQALKFEKISMNDQSATRESSLASFLISRATRNLTLGNYLHWYLVVECDDNGPGQTKEHRKLFQKVEFDFMTELEASPGGSEQRRELLRQGEMITILTKLCRDLQKHGLHNRQRMIEHLKKFLSDPKTEFKYDPAIPLPLDPDVRIVGTFPEECSVFKSSLTPVLLTYKTAEGKRYPVIFKVGDDLRQDQLVLQIISLMDRLLRKENLDLKLTPYRTMATGPAAGAVQFVASMSLQAVKTKYGAKSANFIQEYLKINSPDKNAEYGIRREAMENYVKSCAGYCVVTYLLGVGDRHLDNLLITPDGRFFHIDFGYMLGRDPKPAPPPIKITQAMVDGMGGLQSKNFEQFRLYASTAFTTLRKQSSLILNLFALMTDANIPDIRAEPDKVVEKVRERFALEMTEEDAIREFDGLIHDSLRRVIPYIVDWTHDLVQRYRG